MEWLLGFIVVGLLLAAIVIHVRENLTKNCPTCAKRVPDKAALCPFCGHQFSGPRRETSA